MHIQLNCAFQALACSEVITKVENLGSSYAVHGKIMSATTQ